MPTSFLLCCGLAILFGAPIFTMLWLMHRDQMRLLDKLEKLAQERWDPKAEQHEGFFRQMVRREAEAEENKDGFQEHTDSENDFDDDWDDDEDWEEYNAEEDNEEDWEECDEDDDDEEWDEYDEDEANWDDDEEWDEYDDDIEDEEKP